MIMYYCSVQWDRTTMFHVESVKPKYVKKSERNGQPARGDWGYTTDSRKAKLLTKWQMQRFRNDSIYCNHIPIITSVEVDTSATEAAIQKSIERGN